MDQNVNIVTPKIYHTISSHDADHRNTTDVIKWKYFLRYWRFVRGIHRSPVNSPHKGQWREALMFSLICARINGWVNTGEADDLRRHRNHHDVTVITIDVMMSTLSPMAAPVVVTTRISAATNEDTIGMMATANFHWPFYEPASQVLPMRTRVYIDRHPQTNCIPVKYGKPLFLVIMGTLLAGLFSHVDNASCNDHNTIYAVGLRRFEMRSQITYWR